MSSSASAAPAPARHDESSAAVFLQSLFRGKKARQEVEAHHDTHAVTQSAIDEHVRGSKIMPKGEQVKATFHCALEKHILVQGKLYISDNYLAFYSNILGIVTKELIPVSSITAVQQARLLLIPNSIRILVGPDKKYFFASFINRNNAYEEIRKRAKNAALAPDSVRHSSISSLDHALTIPTSIFGVTLEQVMLMQSANKQYDDLKIPRIIPALIDGIRATSGFGSEGIFRLSVLKSDLTAAHQFLDSHPDWQPSDLLSNSPSSFNPAQNPHVFAAMLKDWLRALAEPLIPFNMYNEAIRLTKAGITPASSTSSSSSSSSSSSPLSSFISSLPSLNRLVLTSLSRMCLVDIAHHPANSVSSKMSVRGLAVVFAPSFIKNPSEDPTSIIANTPYETNFTEALITALGE